MTFEEYRAQDACGLAQLIATGKVKPAELLELAIGRCEEVNPELGAVVYKRYEQARAEADAAPAAKAKAAALALAAARAAVRTAVRAGKPSAESPALGGVPFLVKDLALHVSNTPLSCGSRSYSGFVSSHDSPAVRRVREAGLLILGKTNVPEFGITPYTESKALGPARNPWNTEHTPGGSSGGSGAAVAAGIVPLATASDGGGSIRIPASCCGLFGLKPSRGRVPLATEGWGGGVAEGCLSRSVRDTAAYLDVVAGPAAGDFYPTPKESFSAALQQAPPQGLRIGFSAAHPLAEFGAKVHADCRTAVLDAMKLATGLGHVVEEIDLPWTSELYERDFLPVVVASTAVEAAEAERVQGRRLRSGELETNTRLMVQMGKALRADVYAAALQRWNATARAFGEVHQKYDLICTPTLAEPPASIGRFASPALEELVIRAATSLGLTGLFMRVGLDKIMARRIFQYMPFNPPANMTGAPAASLPLAVSATGLPIGVQFMAPMGADQLLLSFSAQLEQAQPWFARIPH
ncbi:MAG: amidase [Spirochaeta sp.]|nr:amidase [Spirochaeta sp.]